MTELPIVSIVGRPNVGKSSLFNRIVGRRVAVVADREGVTRDRHFQQTDWNGKTFLVVDTGGYQRKDAESLDTLVRQSIETAISESNLVIFVTDGKTGLTDTDMDFARMILKQNVPALLAVNKTESSKTIWDVPEFWNLGLGEPRAVSAIQGSGVADLLDQVIENIKDKAGRKNASEPMARISVLGRPNAGKSTLVNKLLGEQRLIVSDIPGTTRDAIDTFFEFQGQKICLTDTAGLRKKAKVKDEVEYFSNMRSLEAIRRSHVAVILIDSQRGIEEQDLRIFHQIIEMGRGAVFAWNKWDLIDAGDKTFDHMVKEVRNKYPELEPYPIVSVSALSGKRMIRLLETVLKVYKEVGKVLGRDEVVEFFKEAWDAHPHPQDSRGPVFITRCCQVQVFPTMLAFEVNHPDRVLPSYVRYLKRRAHQRFGLNGVPLKIAFRQNLELRKDEELLEISKLDPLFLDGTMPRSD